MTFVLETEGLKTKFGLPSALVVLRCQPGVINHPASSWSATAPQKCIHVYPAHSTAILFQQKLSKQISSLQFNWDEIKQYKCSTY